MSRLSFLFAGLFVFMVGLRVAPVSAQMMASERSQLHQQINGVDVVIDYSRPSIRGRLPIWGGIEPWNILWTPGANSSTTFKFSEDVTLNGTEVAAGKYSVWFELLENDPWSLVLFTDTTMFHVPYPSKDSSMVAIPIKMEEGHPFVETLRFDIENVRMDGADIQFRWADTMIPIRLDIDPGYEMSFTTEDAERYTGDWWLDTSMDRPADSLIAKWRAETPEDELEDLNKWLASYDEPSPISLFHDEPSGRILGYHPDFARLMDMNPEAPLISFVKKAEGIFAEAILIDGEVFTVIEYYLWEFEYDENGRAIEFTQRQGHNDKIIGQGTRQ